VILIRHRINHSVKRRRQALHQTHHHYYLNISVEAANISDSVVRIESNRIDTFLPELECSTTNHIDSRWESLGSDCAVPRSSAVTPHRAPDLRRTSAPRTSPAGHCRADTRPSARRTALAEPAPSQPGGDTCSDSDTRQTPAAVRCCSWWVSLSIRAALQSDQCRSPLSHY